MRRHFESKHPKMTLQLPAESDRHGCSCGRTFLEPNRLQEHMTAAGHEPAKKGVKRKSSIKTQLRIKDQKEKNDQEKEPPRKRPQRTPKGFKKTVEETDSDSDSDVIDWKDMIE